MVMTANGPRRVVLSLGAPAGVVGSADELIAAMCFYVAGRRQKLQHFVGTPGQPQDWMVPGVLEQWAGIASGAS